MAKKSSRITKQTALDPIQMVYVLMKMMGLVENSEQIKVNYEVGKARVSIAVPSIKFALAFDSDKNVSELEERDWVVQRVFRRDLDSFSRIFSATMEGRMARTKALMNPNIKQTSEDEERLLDAILRRGLPSPDRNYKFFKDNGEELTVPDFTWEEYKLCFFMDGAYWHSKVQDAKLIKELKSNAKIKNQAIAQRSDKVAKDNDISAELTVRGYVVLRCTDQDISTEEGLQKQVDRIETIIERSITAQRYIGVKDESGDENSEDITDIFGSNSDEELEDIDENYDPTEFAPVSAEEIAKSMEQAEHKEHEEKEEDTKAEDVSTEDFLSSLFPDDEDMDDEDLDEDVIDDSDSDSATTGVDTNDDKEISEDVENSSEEEDMIDVLDILEDSQDEELFNQ